MAESITQNTCEIGRLYSTYEKKRNEQNCQNLSFKGFLTGETSREYCNIALGNYKNCNKIINCEVKNCC